MQLVAMNNFLPELEQDPFDPEEFVERLAWRATAGKFEPESFDAELLHEAFESGIRELKQIYETHKHKCERSDEVLKNEEKRHWTRVYELQEKCKESFSNFQELDGHLSFDHLLLPNHATKKRSSRLDLRLGSHEWCV